MNDPEKIDDMAAQRKRLHKNHASCRPLSPDYDRVGAAGECAFGDWCGQSPDMTPKPRGDGGVDFHVSLRYGVDVKTARKAKFLLLEEGKPVTDIYVLAEYDDATGTARLLGWAWGSVLVMAPLRDFGCGIQSHHLPRQDLRPMDSLKARMERDG